MRRISPPAAPDSPEYSRMLVLYEALTARVGHRDALLWQSPALAMTAQAFLLTIALGHESRPVARFLAASLGAVVTFMSVQLMLKHWMYLRNDQVVMISLERAMGMPTSAIDHKTQLDHLDADLTLPRLRKRAKEEKGLTRRKSVRVWIVCLTAFGVINLVLAGFAVFDAFGLGCHWTIQTDLGDTRCVIAL